MVSTMVLNENQHTLLSDLLFCDEILFGSVGSSIKLLGARLENCMLKLARCSKIPFFKCSCSIDTQIECSEMLGEQFLHYFCSPQSINCI